MDEKRNNKTKSFAQKDLSIKRWRKTSMQRERKRKWSKEKERFLNKKK